MKLLHNTRRYIFLALILVVAGGVSWWSARSETGVAYHIQTEVTKLVPRFVSNPSSIKRFIVDPILEPILASSLQDVVYESTKLNQSFVVVVTSGDDVSYGDGTATHVAVLEVNHHPIAGLRIICETETDPLLIAGVFSKSFQGANTP